MSTERSVHLTHSWLAAESSLAVAGRVMRAFEVEGTWLVEYQQEGRTLSVWEVADRQDAARLMQAIARLLRWSLLLGERPALPLHLQECSAFGLRVDSAWLRAIETGAVQGA